MADPTDVVFHQGLAGLDIHSSEDSTATHIPTSQPSHVVKSTLTGIPQELRYQIYSHFLKANESAEDLLIDEQHTFSYEVLWICKSLRAEAWDYFCTTNKWIQIGVYDAPNWETCDHHKLSTFGPHALPLKRFSKTFTQQIADHRALTLRIGYGCGLRKLLPDAKLSQRILMTFNRQDWWQFCVQLAADNSRGPLNISVDIGFKYANNDAWKVLIPYCILPLALVRSAARVRFTKMMGSAHLQMHGS